MLLNPILTFDLIRKIIIVTDLKIVVTQYLIHIYFSTSSTNLFVNC